MAVSEELVLFLRDDLEKDLEVLRQKVKRYDSIAGRDFAAQLDLVLEGLNDNPPTEEPLPLDVIDEDGSGPTVFAETVFDQYGFVALEGVENVRRDALAHHSQKVRDWGRGLAERWAIFETFKRRDEFGLSNQAIDTLAKNMDNVTQNLAQKTFPFNNWAALYKGDPELGYPVFVRRLKNCGAFASKITNPQGELVELTVDMVEPIMRSALAHVANEPVDFASWHTTSPESEIALRG